MSDLRIEFEKAAEEVQHLPKKPDDKTLLKLYAFYKQATLGDVAGKRPGFTDRVRRAKYDSWKRLKGLSQEGAMQAYTDLVKRLQG